MEVVHYPVFRDNPSNPARVDMGTGVVEVNDQAMMMLPDYAQRFVMAHERGHWALRSFDEQAADDYALSRSALREPESLWKHVKSVRMVAREDPGRERHAAHSALRIAAREGSEEAKRLLPLYANADGSGRRWLWIAGTAAAVVAIVIIAKKR